MSEIDHQESPVDKKQKGEANRPSLFSGFNFNLLFGSVAARISLLITILVVASLTVVTVIVANNLRATLT